MSVPTIDVERFLSGLGLTGLNRAHEEVYFCCPFHGDSNPSASMKDGSGVWFCFVCQRGGTAVTFMTEYAGIAPAEAARRVREMADLAPADREPEGSLLAEVDAFLSEKREEIRRLPEHDRPLLENWCKAFAVEWETVLVYLAMGGYVGDLSYPFTRGFLPATLDDYDIGYDAISRRMIITVRDIDGNLVGFKGRDVTGGSARRYLILGGPHSSYGFMPYQAGDHVYLLDSCDLEDGPIILCEGELNALMLRQYGYRSAVAISGSYLTDTQAMQVLSKARRDVVLFFDDDEAGRRGAARAARMLEEVVPVKVVGEHEGDPAAMCYEQIDTLLKCAKSSLHIY